MQTNNCQCLDAVACDHVLRVQQAQSAVPAMDGLTRFSQAPVIERVGVFVWLEAIRTEKHQTRF
jgi:hypothetical protein